MKQVVAVAGILIGALAVGAIIGSIAGRAHADRQAASVTTTTSTPSARSVDDRSADCADAINGAGRTVKALLDEAPASAPAADAARAEIKRARERCTDLLPECPTTADAYAGWLDEGVAQAVPAGSASAATPTSQLGDPPSLTCSVSR